MLTQAAITKETTSRKSNYHFSVLITTLTLLGVLLTAPPSSANDQEISKVTWQLNRNDGAGTAREYRNVLTQISNTVSRPTTNGIREIPENTPSNARIDIEILTSEGDSVVFHMRRRNMYIQAFTLRGTSYITSDSVANPMTLAGNVLPFASDYASLGARNNGNISDITLYTVGGASLDTLLHNLIYANESNFNRSAARALYTAAILFSEASRFRPSLGQNIAHAIENGHPYNPTNADSEMIRNWGQMSNWGHAQLQRPDQPPLQLPPHVRANSEGRPDGHGVDKINNLTTLSWLLGILAITKVSG